MTKEELRNYYKIIERNKINDDIEVIDLYNEERSINRHVRLLYAYNKLYYTGDMGTYVFGNNVFNIKGFFKGKEINPYYWSEKVEASSQPLLDTDIDFDKVRELCSDIGMCDPDETANSIICNCQEYSSRFLYACELIQWVENEIINEDING